MSKLGTQVELRQYDEAAYVFAEDDDGYYECIKSRYGEFTLGERYIRSEIDGIEERHSTVILEKPRKLAEVLPFVPRPTPEQEAQAAVIALLERYAELARAGEVTGVIIAAKTKDNVITGEIMAEYMNVNTRERTLLIEEMREVSYYDYDV